MHLSSAGLLSTALILTSLPAVAQDICRGILVYGSRDVIAKTRDAEYSRALYQEHCEGSISKSSSTVGVGLDAVIEAIPVGLKVNTGSSKERLNSFCKKYSETERNSVSETNNSQLVVREALDAFNKCISIASREVFFAPQLARTQLIVDVRRGSRNVDLEGVTYEPSELTCRVPHANNIDQSVTANENTRKTLTDKNYTISCVRKGQNSPNGDRLYPRTEISIATSEGSFVLPIPADAVLAEQWATNISQRLSAVEARVPSLECRTTSSLSPQGRNFEYAVSVPAELRKEWTITGGSCEIVESVGHSAAQMRSVATTEGWLCGAADPPFQAVPLRIRANVIYCRAK